MSTRVCPAWLLALSTALAACEIPFAARPSGDASPVVDTATVDVTDPDAETPDAAAPDVTPDTATDATMSDAAGPDASDAADVTDASDAQRDAADADAADARDASDVLDARDAADVTTPDVPFVRDASDVLDADAADVVDVVDATDVVDVADVVNVTDAGSIAAPRPVAPMPTAAMGARNVTLRWALPPGVDGAIVSLCADPACIVEELSATVTGNSYTFTSDLSPTTHWWRLRGRSGMASGTAFSPIWSFRVLASTSSTNAPWGSWPDLNGDGYSDLLVGRLDTPAYLLGSAAGVSATTTVRTLTTSGLVVDRDFGRVVANAGDTDGDGLTDVLIGGVNGRVWYVRTRAVSTSGVPSFTTPVALQPQVNGTVFTAAGDVNGDGYGDVIVTTSATETLYIYRGSATGLSLTAATMYRRRGGGGLFRRGRRRLQRRWLRRRDRGGFLDALGDVLFRLRRWAPPSRTGLHSPGREGHARSATTTTSPWPITRRPSSAGGVSDAIIGNSNSSYDVILGRTDTAAFSPSAMFTARFVGGAADLNGDGTADFFFADGNGRLAFATTSPLGATLLPTENRSVVAAIASAGDINRDGLGDVVVGNGSLGRIGVFYGARGTTPYTFAEGPSALGTNFGYSVALRSPPRALGSRHGK
ncbi:MAG: VCBS repeat-containing protein [Polyangiales bacterium]